MLKTKKVTVIDVQDWDKLVEQTYGRKYDFQQQDGCKDRGQIDITVPCENPFDYENETVPEVVNHGEMGVSFKAWLERDPSQLIPFDSRYISKSWTPTDEDMKEMQNQDTQLWWERNFYPSVDMVINDLHAKGLIESGEYVIDIDW